MHTQGTVNEMFIIENVMTLSETIANEVVDKSKVCHLS